MKYRNIKIRILAYSFLLPVIIIGGLMLVFTYTDLRSIKFLSGASSAGTLIVILIQRYFSDDKFLADISIKMNKLILTYFNSLTEKDQLAIHDTTIEDVIIKKKRFFLWSLNSITFLSKKNKIRFLLFDKELGDIERMITLFRASLNR